ncbi:MAG TPA: hypothetical protein PKN50_01920 [Spirochaetota bacterium]|nr:hypothetical protein [Spirochaetota bacterium]HPV42088.1 hypothetical protein [Spirochaetota bacterium]
MSVSSDHQLSHRIIIFRNRLLQRQAASSAFGSGGTRPAQVIKILTIPADSGNGIIVKTNTREISSTGNPLFGVEEYVIFFILKGCCQFFFHDYTDDPGVSNFADGGVGNFTYGGRPFFY